MRFHFILPICFHLAIILLLDVDNSVARKSKYTQVYLLDMRNKWTHLVHFKKIPLVWLSKVKCYTCHRSKTTDKCPNDIGELQTCTEPGDVCFRMYKTKLADYDKGEEKKHLQVGETHKSGCTDLKTYQMSNLGCEQWKTHMDFCSCNTDRCNNAGLVMESKE